MRELEIERELDFLVYQWKGMELSPRLWTAEGGDGINVPVNCLATIHLVVGEGEEAVPVGTVEPIFNVQGLREVLV